MKMKMKKLTVYYPQKMASDEARYLIQRGKKFPFKNIYHEQLMEVIAGLIPSEVPFSRFHLGQEVTSGKYIAYINVDDSLAYAYIVNITTGDYEVFSERKLYETLGYKQIEGIGWVKV